MDAQPVLAVVTQPSSWLVTVNLMGLSLLVLWISRYRALNRDVNRRIEVLAEVIENQTEGVYTSSISGKQLTANKSLAALNGYETPQELVESVNDIATEWYIKPDRRREFQQILHANGRVNEFVSEVRRHKTGEHIWISENAWLIYDKSGLPVKYAGTVRDVTEAQRTRVLEEQLEKLADNLPGGLFQTEKTPDGKYTNVYLSQVFRSMMQMPDNRKASSPKEYINRIHPDDRLAYLAAIRNSEENPGSFNHDFRLVLPNGIVNWASITATTERREDGTIVWHGFLADATERKQAEAKFEKLAFHDPLTELPNRRFFIKRLDQTIATCARRKENAAIIFMDLDDFKALNDNRGHEIGDELLQRVSRRLCANVRANDTVSRFGGDEFVILLEDLGEDPREALSRARAVTEKIIGDLRRGFELSDGAHVSTPSIGLALFNGGSRSSEEVISMADNAMYLAKKAGRNTYMIYDPDKVDSADTGADLAREFRNAIKANELSLQYQPQVDRSGLISGAEALVRWNHPVHGMLSPAKFMPLAEKAGMMNEINDWVLREACEVLQAWHADPKTSELSLSVNMSPQKFSEPRLIDEFGILLDGYTFQPDRLVIEVTETALARNPDRIATQMRAMKQFGIRFSLDDFGTGHSSLSQLNRFPLDEVKIDGSFVSEIETTESNRTLIEGILGMAQALQLETVAEHVSSFYQENFLKTRGCMRFQGYYYHAPVNYAEFMEMKGSRPAEASETTTGVSQNQSGLRIISA